MGLIQPRHPFAPVWLSALVWPGLGQCVQRRWLAGVLFGVLFLASLAWVFSTALQTLVAGYRWALEPGDADAPRLRVWRLVAGLFLCLVFHVVSVADCWWAAWRRRPLQRPGPAWPDAAVDARSPPAIVEPGRAGETRRETRNP